MQSKSIIKDAQTIIFRTHKKRSQLKEHGEHIKKLYIDEASKLAKSALALKTGKTSPAKLKEFSLRKNKRIFQLIKKRIIPIFGVHKKIKDNKLKNENDITQFEKDLHIELHELAYIIEFGFVILHRLKHENTAVHEKMQKQIETAHIYVKEKIIDKIEKSTRLQLHEMKLH